MADYAMITHKGFKFLITKNPSNTTLDAFIKELKKHNVKIVVRVCEPTYDTEALKGAGIQVCNLNIPDGTSPSEKIIDEFFDILKRQYNINPESCVAVHCVAGLGRAPVMVAVALIELGFTYEDAVDLIREKRRGAINAKQLEFLSKYKSRSRLVNDKKKACIIQ
ncbi:protein-tyrosine phosphatase 4A family member PRL-1 isoform X2 [Leptinotarsa decemlineata]|nr:protein tyrosine phosphatase type IVA 1 isoform X2 [Leptinotarsa decemlineata]XP_023015465.1 protein tyrosine phosphatase type IVA 1 isoform X2 [Leptinotarsa decemlineata]XP_023015466.1 protein tyrosine phosphatase type IVA 1 isoform X2 [Leptinotarsa decemlineata]XP_023015467.1 protein tyrosine phosphatase type IVA 1 isoform X2 [Leptinotarsa decemlineata]XP_023015468.1 protein tyrosine phosphatase type IVA 1 isoform X2 [Leptinotarsa decemlineata]XP_023015469.1 protein tyrosine phosphatase t